jgi:hypothetical protein
MPNVSFVSNKEDARISNHVDFLCWAAVMHNFNGVLSDFTPRDGNSGRRYEEEFVKQAADKSKLVSLSSTLRL